MWTFYRRDLTYPVRGLAIFYVHALFTHPFAYTFSAGIFVTHHPFTVHASLTRPPLIRSVVHSLTRLVVHDLTRLVVH